MAFGPCKPSANASTLNPLAERLGRESMSTEDGADAVAMFEHFARQGRKPSRCCRRLPTLIANSVWTSLRCKPLLPAAARSGESENIADPPITRHFSEKKPSWFRTTVDFKSTPLESFDLSARVVQLRHFAVAFSEAALPSPTIASTPGSRSPLTTSVRRRRRDRVGPGSLLVLHRAGSRSAKRHRASLRRRGRAASGQIAQRLIGCAQDVVAPVDHDPDRRRHARLQQQIRIGRADDHAIGHGVLDSAVIG
jgi:hypothetical protein